MLAGAMQSFEYGIAAFLLTGGVMALCSGVKAIAKRFLKRRDNHDDQ